MESYLHCIKKYFFGVLNIQRMLNQLLSLQPLNDLTVNLVTILFTIEKIAFKTLCRVRVFL